MQKIQFVFIVGLGGDAEHWNPHFIEKLLTGLPESSAITVDFPGAGIYFEMAAPLTIKENVEHLRLQWKTKKTGNVKTILVAESMGGMAGVYWAQHYPQEVDGLVLLNTSIGSFSPFFHRLKPSVYAKIIKAHLPQLSAEERDKRKFAIITNNSEQRDKHLPRLTKTQETKPLSLSTVLKQLLAAGLYFPSKRKKPKMPILILTSQEDQLVDYKCSLAIQKYWGGDLRIHPTGGHILHIDDENWTSEQISQWINARFA